MKVVFFESEKIEELQQDVNDFLDASIQVQSIQYQSSIVEDEEEYFIVYSVMILYQEEN